MQEPPLCLISHIGLFKALYMLLHPAADRIDSHQGIPPSLYFQQRLINDNPPRLEDAADSGSRRAPSSMRSPAVVRFVREAPNEGGRFTEASPARPCLDESPYVKPVSCPALAVCPATAASQ